MSANNNLQASKVTITDAEAKANITDVRKLLAGKETNDINVRLFIIWKRKKEVLFSLAETDDDVKQSFIDRVLKDYEENSVLSKYSVLLEKTNNIIYDNEDEFPLVSTFISKIESKEYIDNLATVKKHLNWVKGYCAEIIINDEHIYTFGSTNTFNALLKKGNGFIGKITSNPNGNVDDHVITKLSEEESFIGFNSKTTCYVYKSMCIIRQKKAFEDLFGLLELYKKNAQTTINCLKDNKKFYHGISAIGADLDKRPILYRSLSNLSKHLDRLEKITEHLNEIKKIKSSDQFKDKYDKIEFDGTGLIYSADALVQFLSLLNEKPVKSLITGDEFLANREE